MRGSDGDASGASNLTGGRDFIEVPLDRYHAFLATLPDAVQKSLAETWGAPESDPSFSAGHFRFPCVRAGKVTILFQPDRGALADRKQGYHDVTCAPRHGYVALYAWLRERERIDAMIHLGTHGTLEWLPGKALALSSACFPEAVLGPIPVIYPFIVNNPGEAVQAKRRLSAVTIGHLTPPLTKAGLHGGMAELEGLLEEYAEAEGVDRRRAKLIEEEVLDRAWRSGLAKDCGVTPGDAPREALAKLDAQLCDIKELAIRDKLHVFGRAPDAESSRRAHSGDRPGDGAQAGRSQAGRSPSVELRRLGALGPPRRARRTPRGSRRFRRADARAARRSSHRQESHDNRSALNSDADSHGDRRQGSR